MNKILLCLLGLMAVLLNAGWLPSAAAQSDDDREVQRARMSRLNPRMSAAMPIDLERVADAGVFVTSGKNIDLYSDIDDDVQRQQWVDLFDGATVQWCKLFNVDIDTTKPWRMTAVIMKDQTRITNAGLIPDDLPKFPAGYNRGHEFWVYLQNDQYYTRHLILHEGTHAFMQWFLSSSGPPWYSEGMAEWVALHSWDGQRVKLNQTITDKSQTPGWGRVNLLKKLLAKGPPKSLDDIFNTPPTAFRDVNAYAWSWAGCEFLAHHRLSKEAFAELPKRLRGSLYRFRENFRAELQPHWQALSRDWYLYIHEVGYGTDIEATALNEATKNDDGSFNITATSSWQSTGITVTTGDAIKITSSGDFIVGNTTKPWRCESDGITAEYYGGHPLGKLMGAVITDGPEQIVQIPVGNRPDTGKPLTFTRDGVLALRINESPAKLGDNSGRLKVSIEKLK
jgi:hypothetical protein